MKRFLFLLLGILLGLQCVLADEGMWLLDQLNTLHLKQKGLQLQPEDIYTPGKVGLASAVVNLGGASAELVSPDGLILTNHHVAFGAVQRASTQGTDYLTNGFLAKTRADEIPAPGYVARIFLGMEDVTAQVLKGMNQIKDVVKRERAIKERIKEMEESLEKESSDLDVRIVPMFAGLKYYLFRYKRIEDVRMVFIPPRAIGNYGGDVDNWMWPRHTGDFSFLRLYVAPDGKGAKYSEDNVPYHPKRWIKISKTPLKPGDLTFIIGYPGRTQRYSTSYAVAFAQNKYYPVTIKALKETIAFLDEVAKQSPQLAIKAAGMSKWLNNSMKNFEGNVQGMKKNHLLEQKQAQEKEFMAFVNSHKEMKTRYGDLLQRFKQEYEKSAASFEREFFLGRFNFLAGTIPSVASSIYYVAEQRAKAPEERDPGFSEKDVKRSVERLKYRYMSYAPEIDKGLLKRFLKKLKNLPADQQISALNFVFRDYPSVDAFVDSAYAHTRLTDPQFAQSLFQKSLDELNKMNDPFLKLARAVQPEFDKIKKEQEKHQAVLRALEREYLSALMAWQKRPFYPDANGTIRFTYGKISGYFPRDAVWYEPFTTLKGVMEKETGERPFIVPAKLKALYEKQDYDGWMDKRLNAVPVDFLNECDITGGNSGSPTFNAKGELVGIAFDGNWEALTSDWKYEPAIQRAINVDIRYVLFITDKFAGAGYLLKELDLR